MATIPYNIITFAYIHTHILYIGNPSISGQTLGIVIVFLVMMIVLVCPFVYVFGRVYWAKRHNYGCYNTLTTPSSWCSGGTTRRRTWQPPRTIPTTAGSSGNAFVSTVLLKLHCGFLSIIHILVATTFIK